MPTGTPRLRPATEADTDEIARIWHIGWRDAHEGRVPTELYRFRTAETYPPRVRSRIGRTVAAERDGLLLGFVVVTGDEVEQIYVDRPARGTGTASALLDRAEAEITASGYRTAWLAVVEANARARTFYEHAGWVDAESIDYDAEVGGGTITVRCRRYEKVFAEPPSGQRARGPGRRAGGGLV